MGGVMLDDRNILKQRDPEGTLELIANLYEALVWQPEILSPEHDGRTLTRVIVAGMGGSALAAEIIRPIASRELSQSFEIVKGYDLPSYADEQTLVFTVSHSGNTEETLDCYEQARQRGCQIAIITAGGHLGEYAERDNIVHAIVPAGAQPRMSIFHHLRAMLLLLEHFGICDDTYSNEVKDASDWLRAESVRWHADVPVHDNYAKQLALLSVGKTPIIYGGPLTAPLAYKWKISWNENAKNVAFCGQYSEFSHNEFIGWSSHPIEKPFIIFDLMSNLERPRIRERMELSDRLLSGRRPKANPIELAGENYWQQALWACVLADAASSYVGVLNGVKPGPTELADRFKVELGQGS